LLILPVIFSTFGRPLQSCNFSEQLVFFGINFSPRLVFQVILISFRFSPRFYKLKFLTMIQPFDFLFSFHGFRPRATQFNIDKLFRFMHPRVSGTFSIHMQTYSRIQIRSASRVETPIPALNYVNIVRHSPISTLITEYY
jgi:hypothetical protein